MLSTKLTPLPRVAPRRWAAALTLAAGITLAAEPVLASGFPFGRPDFDLKLKPLGTYATGLFGESAAEIPAYDPLTRRVFVVSAATDAVDVLDIRDPEHPTKLFAIDLSRFGSPNSVAVRDGVLAVAVENSADKQANGLWCYTA
ncbi:MAG: hypothetical protein HC834_01505 [Rhodospirillales bacterium]|nr:hypothetical protein [Rhodospirillales bacterium]